MANRVISIEVGKSITRAVEMDYKAKNPKIYSCFSFETPMGVLEDGLIRPDENFCNVLKGAMKHFRVRARKAVFTINSGRIANREITIPLVKENKIRGLLLANSSEYFPVDFEKHQMVYRIMEKVDTKEDKHYKLSVLAVPNDLIKSYEKFAADCNLTIMAMDYVGNSIGQVMKKTIRDDSVILIKVDETSSMLTVMKNGEVDLQRNISYGIEEAVETMMSTNVYGEQLSYADALQIMRRRTCIRKHLDVEMGYREEEDESPDIARAREEITEALRMLIGNIGRVLDYYLSRNTDADIRHIKLIGLGADCSGLSKLMTNELGIKVTPLQEFPEINMNRIMQDGSFKIAEYVTCIGASFAPMNFRLGDRKDGASEEEESLFLPGLVFTVCIISCAAMVGFTMFKSWGLEDKKEEYSERIAELYPAQQVYMACNAALEELQSCKNVYSLTATPLDRALKLLEELEEKMPDGVRLSAFNMSAEGVSFNVTASSKEGIAELLIRLRSSEVIGSVAAANLTTAVDETGAVSVTTVISCAFTNATAAE